MSTNEWTDQEKAIALHAFEIGNKRCIEVLIDSLRDLSAKLDSPESVWRFHDYLSSERYAYEGRSAFDEANALFSLADMVKLGLISFDNLEGLDQLKISKIRAMSMF